MAVSLGSSSNLASTSTAMPSPPLPPPRSSSLSPGTGGGGSSAGASASSGRSRSSRRGGSHSHREVKFGNYILGQTLGEGEFGKVKLGWRRPEPGQVSGDGVQVGTHRGWTLLTF
jgi:protein-serine/threonine kinase